MPRGKRREAAVSDEQIIAALISYGKLKDAAKACGLPLRTLYDRMSTAEFKAMYLAAKTDILRTAGQELNGHLGKAIGTIAEIMTDAEATPATRLAASNAIINHALKLAARVELVEEGAVDEDTATSIIDEELKACEKDLVRVISDMYGEVLTYEQKIQLAEKFHDLEERRKAETKKRHEMEKLTGEKWYSDD